METIAVYWEPKIRVYGLTTQSGLALFNLNFPAKEMDSWGREITALGENGKEFALVTLQVGSGASLQLGLLLALDDKADAVRQRLEKRVQNQEATNLRVISPVELIYLHGPHFQDRYGIADAAFFPLYRANIPILSAACAGTSVYIVVPGGRAAEVATCLAETFVL